MASLLRLWLGFVTCTPSFACYHAGSQDFLSHGNSASARGAVPRVVEPYAFDLCLMHIMGYAV